MTPTLKNKTKISEMNENKVHKKRPINRKTKQKKQTQKNIEE